VLIGLTHRCLAVANTICGSLRQDLRIVVGHVVQVGSSFRARTARQDHRRGTPSAGASSDRSGHRTPPNVLNDEADTAGITQIR
jgi:hypothetical protein